MENIVYKDFFEYLEKQKYFSFKYLTKHIPNRSPCKILSNYIIFTIALAISVKKFVFLKLAKIQRYYYVFRLYDTMICGRSKW